MSTLAKHLRLAHEVTVTEYQDLYGLPRTVGLVGSIVRAKLSEVGRVMAERNGLPGMGKHDFFCCAAS